MKKKYIYKHLTKEMQDILSEKIKEEGKDNIYNKVRYNIELQYIAKVQNKEHAFDKVYNGICLTERWWNDYFHDREIIDMENLSLEQEMLYFIDKDKFMCE